MGAIAPNLIAFHISGEVKIELDQSHLTAMAGITCALGCICHDLGRQDEVLWKSKSGRAELADGDIAGILGGYTFHLPEMDGTVYLVVCMI